jgi:hypothetical protein
MYFTGLADVAWTPAMRPPAGNAGPLHDSPHRAGPVRAVILSLVGCCGE